MAKIWELPSKFNEKEVQSIKMILQDNKENRMIASISKALVQKWSGLIVQFQIFPLEAFRFRTIVELLNADKIHRNDLRWLVRRTQETWLPVTTKGKETKRMVIVLKDLEHNKIDCILFGKMVDQILLHLEDGTVEPVIVLLQFFKAIRWNGISCMIVYINLCYKNTYLSIFLTNISSCQNAEKTSLQNHFEVSKIHINSQLKEIETFKSKLLSDAPATTSVRISQISSQSRWSVFLVRAWDVPSRFNDKEVMSMELVFQDSKATSIPKPLVKKWKDVIVELQMYMMKNFVVSDNTTHPKVTPDKYIFVFSHRTRVHHIEHPSFPLDAFRLKSFKELLTADKLDDFEFIGKKSFGSAKKILGNLVTSKRVETKRLAIILQDLDNNMISCSLFGKMVDTLLPHLHDGRVEPLILHINDGLKEVVGFRNRLLSGVPEGPIWICASIVSLNVSNDDWFYKSCRKCPKKKVDTPIGNRYECTKCGHTYGSRYRSCSTIELVASPSCFRIRKQLNFAERKLNNLSISKNFDQIYIVIKFCDDEDIIEKNMPKEIAENTSTFVIDGMEEYISTLKCKISGKRTTSLLKTANEGMNENEDEGQLSTNRGGRKGVKRIKANMTQVEH
ncbi:hypothetical protein Ahy_A02g008073 [Arachis hypogaea]|uniref:Replication protein A 70 kDa DNA-binding subunit B/D first OB fold domain-containing protein n=1 Tax=Arachis hypogaea TaxID=3818 RepID=A0A445EEF3_ARAHY|nr:hypothetical protein Ahy_A02g008073 [Arachis hypogaea]